jgi:hypothetical protein
MGNENITDSPKIIIKSLGEQGKNHNDRGIT